MNIHSLSITLVLQCLTLSVYTVGTIGNTESNIDYARKLADSSVLPTLSLIIDLTQWYAIALGGLVALLLLSHRILLMIRIALSYAASCLLKRKYRPQVHRYVRSSGKATLMRI